MGDLGPMNAVQTFAIVEKLQTKLALLERQRTEEMAGYENEQKKISMEKVEIELLDRELDLLAKDIKSVEERIAFNKESGIPQLHNDLKAKEEYLAAKKDEFRKALEHHEGIWQKYEAVYNTYPRVAERNEMAKKAVLLRSTLMKKKQEIAEKEKEVIIVKENKARRLAGLKEDFHEWHTIEQNEKTANAALLQQIRETEKRIAEKEAEKCSQTNIPLDSPKNVPFKIPTMNFLDVLKNVAPLKMLGPGQNTNLGHGSQSNMSPATHPPVTLTCSSDVTNKCQARNVSHVGLSNQDRNLLVNEAESGGVKELDVSTSTAIPFSCSETLVQLVQAAPSVVPHSVSPVGCKKKVITLSTDNIAAKIKESILHDEKSGNTPAAQKSISSTFDQDSRLTEERTESQSVVESNNTDIQEDLSLLPVETAMNNKKDESCNEKENQRESEDIFEDVDSRELSESNFNGYNTEYREDMYDDLQSPPPFEVVMSPAHASFSPPLSFEEENQADKEGNSIPSPSPFGFGFFKSTGSATNIFGGQSDSNDASKSQDKTSSSFPFFF